MTFVVRPFFSLINSLNRSLEPLKSLQQIQTISVSFSFDSTSRAFWRNCAAPGWHLDVCGVKEKELNLCRKTEGGREENRKHKRIVRNKQKLWLHELKPQSPPVGLLRCLSYSHSFTCCPSSALRSIRYSFVFITRLVCSRAKQCHCKKFCLWVLQIHFRHLLKWNDSTDRWVSFLCIHLEELMICAGSLQHKH